MFGKLKCQLPHPRVYQKVAHKNELQSPELVEIKLFRGNGQNNVTAWIASLYAADLVLL